MKYIFLGLTLTLIETSKFAIWLAKIQNWAFWLYDQVFWAQQLSQKVHCILESRESVFKVGKPWQKEQDCTLPFLMHPIRKIIYWTWEILRGLRCLIVTHTIRIYLNQTRNITSFDVVQIVLRADSTGLYPTLHSFWMLNSQKGRCVWTKL